MYAPKSRTAQTPHSPNTPPDATASSRPALAGHSFADLSPTPPVQRQAAPIQRSFWNGKDVENDFWGTKENLGDRWGGTADAAMATFWDVAGGVPMIGPALSGGVDLGKTVLTGGVGAMMGLEAGAERAFGMGGTAAELESERWLNASHHFMHDTEMDAIGMIPGVGTAIAGASAVNDGAETWSRAWGGKPGTLAGDTEHDILGGLGL